jgi:nucleotide-binding universal stress UspA family protein
MSDVITVKHILFPTDFSTTSTEAQRYAVSLAKQLGAQVHLLHAIEPIDVESGEADPEVDEFIRRLEARARNLMERLAVYFDEAGVETTQEVVVGRRWTAIVKRAQELRVDLIIMGTHGIRIDDEQVILGSTSHRVPYLAPCPVLLVRESSAAHSG